MCFQNNVRFLLLLIIPIISGCFSTKNSSDEFLIDEDEKIPIININEITDSISVNLEDITEWFRFVRLETNNSCFVGGSPNKTIIINEDYILVSGAEYSKKLLQFNIEGEFIKTAAIKGKGPNDFLALMNTFIRDSILYYTDFGGRGYSTLNLNSGKIVILPKAKDKHISDFTFIDEKTIFCISTTKSENNTWRREIFTQDIYGNLLYEQLWDIVDSDVSMSYNMFSSLNTIDNHIYFSSPSCDSILEFKNNILIPVWYNQISPKYKPGKTHQIYPVVNLMHFSDEFVLFEYHNVEVKGRAWHHRKREQIFIDRKNDNSGIIKDVYIKKFDFRIYDNFNTENENLFFLEYSAFELKEKIAISLNNGKLNQEHRLKLEKLNSEISNEDNPILLIGKFK